MKLHSFPFYVDDWRGSDTVAGLSLAEEGLYLRLLCAQFRDPRRSLSSARPELARIARVSLKEFERHWPAIAPCFQPVGADRIANRKLRDVTRAVVKFANEKRAKAKVAAKRRWGQQLPLSFGHAHAVREHANLTVPIPNRNAARGRARMLPDLPTCPHEPRCLSQWICGRRCDLAAAVAEGRVSVEEAAQLEAHWTVKPGQT